MPSNLLATSPFGVLPNGVFTQFEESHVYPLLFQSYHDGTNERGLITDGVNPADSIKTWKLQVRRTAADIATLKAFYEGHNGPLQSFYFYNPYEPQTGYPIGSNYDGTGENIYGRHTCKFLNQQWEDAYDIARANVNLQIIEVA
jgi:phage-related protein